jgi:c-di-GMP-binding flagellar brake protein YcgR
MNAPGPDPWVEFRITHLPDCLQLLQALRDGQVPVVLNLPDGSALPTALWSVDAAAQRLSFSAEGATSGLDRLVECNEATAVAYLASVKLQFDLQGFVLVHGDQARALHCQLPREIYRFQRRHAFRVRSSGRPDPVVTFRHHSLPEMKLTLRMLDVSIGGCALWLPADVPPLQAGTRLGELQVELDAETRFSAPAMLQHISSLGNSSAGGNGHGNGGAGPENTHDSAPGGVRIGCEWQALPGSAERVLQRWIDRAQQRQRLLANR